MSRSMLARQKRAASEPDVSPLPPAPEPAVADALPAAASSGHTLARFAIQRCGPVPCNCSEEERAAYEESHEAGDDHDHDGAHGRSAGYISRTVQRAPDDSLSAPDVGDGVSTLGGNQPSDATLLNAGANGSTTIHAPTMAYNTYSAPTLAALDQILPEEVGSVTFDFTVSASGDPITSARLNVTQVMTMPRWTEYSSQCQPVKRAWDSFYAALRNHEDGHVTRDNQQFAGQHSRFIGQTQSDTQTISDQLRTDVQAVQDAYDSSTDHGRTQTPPTILDTSPTCGPGGATSELGAPDLGSYADTSESTDTMPTMQASRADGGDFDLDGDAMAASVERVVSSGGGQPLDDDTRRFMESRFGHDFGRVRVHTDSEAARSAASVRSLAYTVGNDIVFAAGHYTPESTAGRHLLAHELTHVVQQSAGPVAGAPLGNGLTLSDPSDRDEQAAEANARAVMGAENVATTAEASTVVGQAQRQVQRWTMPLITLKSNAELIEDGANGDLQAIKEISDFSGATDDQRISMIRTLLDQFWVGPRDESALERIWDSFGFRALDVAAAHMDLWRQSDDRGAELLDKVFAAKVKKMEFPDDVKAVVSAYLSSNLALTERQMKKLFDPRELVMLQMEAMGAPSPDSGFATDPASQQADYVRRLQTAAVSVAKLQQAQEDARKINVGYELVTDVAGPDAVTNTWMPVQFDPYKPPQFDSKPELSTFAQIASSSVVIDAQLTPYATVKEKYDLATAAIAAWQTKYPELYAVSRERQSTVTAAFAAKTPEQARKQLGLAMLSLTHDIVRTQQMLDDGDLDPLDMLPIHDQLFHNQLLGGVQPESGTNWADPAPNWIAKELIGDHNFWKVLKRLALDTVAAAGYLLAPFTDGASLLVSLAVAGYEAAQSEMNYEAMAQASRTSVTPGTDIYTQQQVDDAKMQADSDAIALALAILAIGVAAATEALGAIRGPNVPKLPEIPQGLTEEQFQTMSATVRSEAGEISGDIRVQGSRAAGTARPDSDIDIAIRVPQDKFNELIEDSFGKPNPGSAKERTMLRAIESGKIQAGEAGLRPLRKTLEGQLGMDVDISVVRIGGPFDNGPMIPLK